MFVIRGLHVSGSEHAMGPRFVNQVMAALTSSRTVPERVLHVGFSPNHFSVRVALPGMAIPGRAGRRDRARLGLNRVGARSVCPSRLSWTDDREKVPNARQGITRNKR